ncbi:MAG: pilus assembly protein PilM [Verrucomicrobiota bacterium]
MGLPFLQNGSRKKRDQMIAVDLGSRITKAVAMQRRGDGFALTGFALLDAPIYEKNLSAEMLAEHLKAVAQLLEAKTKLVALTLGVNDALVRHVEMPPMPADEMRSILKLNSRVYLQQDLPNHVFDCDTSIFRAPDKKDAGKNLPPGAKQKVLIAGAKKQLVDDFIAGTKAAGLAPDYIVPGVVAPVNAFERAMPEVFAKEVVALVDVGFKSSSISILREGELALNRVVSIGGDRLTAGLSESMNISYAEAEGIKVGMAHEVESALEMLLVPLGRELRASIDFFEHQHDRPVGHVYLSGGSARSDLVVQTLQRELAVECKVWNPTAQLQLALPAKLEAEVEHVAPQLTAAIGAALTAL